MSLELSSAWKSLRLGTTLYHWWCIELLRLHPGSYVGRSSDYVPSKCSTKNIVWAHQRSVVAVSTSCWLCVEVMSQGLAFQAAKSDMSTHYGWTGTRGISAWVSPVLLDKAGTVSHAAIPIWLSHWRWGFYAEARSKKKSGISAPLALSKLGW
jgi:hypothetical protein